jgi:hypothetical protein
MEQLTPWCASRPGLEARRQLTAELRTARLRGTGQTERRVSATGRGSVAGGLHLDDEPREHDRDVEQHGLERVESQEVWQLLRAHHHQEQREEHDERREAIAVVRLWLGHPQPSLAHGQSSTLNAIERHSQPSSSAACKRGAQGLACPCLPSPNPATIHRAPSHLMRTQIAAHALEWLFRP